MSRLPLRFSGVDKNLFRGGEPSLAHLNLLKENGLKRIVSLDEGIGNKIKPFCKKNGINHIIVPIEDGNSPAVGFLPFLVGSLQDEPTYIHCHLGRDRTGMAIAIFRMLVNKWTKEDAIEEAKNFGMGNGLPEEFAETFYKAVEDHSLTKEDINDGLSIVDLQRDHYAFDQHPPFIDDPSKVTPFQQSFAPFGGADNYGATTEVFRDEPSNSLSFDYWHGGQELWDLSHRIYKYCPPSHALSRNRLWYPDPASAKGHAEGELEGARLFSALINPLSKGVTHPFNATRRMVQDGMLQGYDIICFVPISGAREALVVNPTVITDLKDEEAEDGADVNDSVALQMGLDNFSQYNGLAQYNFPGSSGLMEGVTGGLAGFMTLPYGLNF